MAGLFDLLPTIGDVVNKLVDRIPDPAAREKAKLEAENSLLNASIKQMEGQIAINIEEAKNPNIFVAGWRPMIGWACASAFVFMYVVAPIINWLGAIFGFTLPVPQFQTDELMSLTFGMLGIAGFRTFEKFKGVARG
jgi:hypothetical protein